ncbi:MAG: hypothetical protein Q9195_007238 [Heterodermia aff. obscurata]
MRYAPPSRLASFWHLLKSLVREPEPQLYRFCKSNFKTFPSDETIEEEAHDNISKLRYYPVQIGDIIEKRYQILGKLGYGLGSTVWLANETRARLPMVLKIFTNDAQNRAEFDVYKHLMSVRSKHPGRNHIRKALDNFTMKGPDGEHHCLVHEPMLENITAWNILFGLQDKSIADEFVKAEQEYPSARKEMQGYTVYASRALDAPSSKSIGLPLLSDFGAAVSGDIEHHRDVQPNVYKAPEVCLKAPWSYSIDIWNVGCLVCFTKFGVFMIAQAKSDDQIWDLFEDRHLFYGVDPKERAYMTRAHLAEMIALIGPPPPELLKAGKRTAEFFDEDGKIPAASMTPFANLAGGWRAEIPVPDRTCLEDLEENLEGSKKKAFLRFVRKMIQ